MENKIIKTAQLIADLYNTDNGGVMFSLSNVMNKKIKYKNGGTCTIVGGNEQIGLLNEWENENVSGFGRLEDIIEVESINELIS